MKQLAHFALAAVATMLVVTAAPAQIKTDKGAKSDEIMRKMRQVDLLVQIMPLAMTKPQIRALLTTIEKCRDKEKLIRSREDDDLAKLEARLTATIDGAMDKGTMPDKTILGDIFNLTRAFSIRRRVALSEMIEDVYLTVDKELNDGQKKAMANSLDPRAIDPTVKVDELKDADRIKLFIRQIFLDELSYQLLVKLSK